MKFSVFTPPASESKKVPVGDIVMLLAWPTICALKLARPLQVLYFLSGLTCDDQTFIVKSNAQRKAAEHGIALVVCDTSPRGLNIAGEEDDWDFGTGAGFYLNASPLLAAIPSRMDCCVYDSRQVSPVAGYTAKVETVSYVRLCCQRASTGYPKLAWA